MTPQIFNGMRVTVAPMREVPRRQLSTNVPLSDEFRAAMNAWLRDFFGVDYFCSVGENEVLRVMDTLWMRETTWVRVKEAMQKGGA